MLILVALAKELLFVADGQSCTQRQTYFHPLVIISSYSLSLTSLHLT